METIRNYLETMFRNMPNTPEVRRAKDELWQMMEDKYSSLMEDGIPENEAIAHVISEFGNLDDLSEVLDIQRYLPARIENEKRAGRELTLEQVRACVKDDRFAVILLAFGVFLCIVSVCGPILLEGIGDTLGLGSLGGLGTALFFILVTAGVVSIVYSQTYRKKWKFIKKEPCSIDFATAAYLDEVVQTQAPQLTLIRGVGIVLCVLSIVPVMIFSDIRVLHDLFDSLGVCLLFIMVGVGVMLIIFATLYNRAAKRLLKLNSEDTVGGHYADAPNMGRRSAWADAGSAARGAAGGDERADWSRNRQEAGNGAGSADWTKNQQEAVNGAGSADWTKTRWQEMRGGGAARRAARREARRAMDQALNESGSRTGFILSVYWQTVTCLYLCASFLTFAWGATWLIWPVAWVIERVIRMNAEG